ncbi:transporter substrate-binding domain-containing protein [Alteromonas sp. KUL49]|nr:transporter substrate-binding domain-containing protein [Alteromonas sp. KUL49]
MDQLTRVIRFISLFICAVLSSFAHSEITPVKYCIDPSWAPYEALVGGEHVGISAEYMKAISAISSIEFELVETETWAQSLEFLQRGECQMLSMLTESERRRQFLAFSDAYFEAPNVLVAAVGTPILQGYDGVGSRLLGVVRGYRQMEYITRYYPSLRIKVVESERDGLNMLLSGELDVMVGSLLTVNTFINMHNLDSLAIVGYAEPYDVLSFGVAKSHTHILPLLNDAIAKIPEDKEVAIYKQWSSSKVRYNATYMPYALGMVCFVGSLCWFIWRARVRQHIRRLLREKNEEIQLLKVQLSDKSRTLEFLTTRDGLTGLYNRNHMMQRAEEEISRFQRFHSSASLIVFDVNFSAASEDVETTLDASQKQIATTCLSAVREVDVVARFTSERFVVLCPQTDIEAAKILVYRLRDSLMAQGVVKDQNLGVVYSVSELQSAETFLDWEDRTVKALYQSKRYGSGTVTIAD